MSLPLKAAHAALACDPEARNSSQRRASARATHKQRRLRALGYRTRDALCFILYKDIPYAGCSRLANIPSHLHLAGVGDNLSLDEAILILCRRRVKLDRPPLEALGEVSLVDPSGKCNMVFGTVQQTHCGLS